MKTSMRLEQALQKLYRAFNNNTLYPECCKQCAVGHILDNTDSWKYLSDSHGSLELNYIGKVHETLGRKFNGYSPKELLHIEVAFLKACGYSLPLHYRGTRPTDPLDKDVLFKGLYAAIRCLCALDGISNIIDLKAIFAYLENVSPRENIVMAHSQK